MINLHESCLIYLSIHEPCSVKREINTKQYQYQSTLILLAYYAQADLGGTFCYPSIFYVTIASYDPADYLTKWIYRSIINYRCTRISQ